MGQKYKTNQTHYRRAKNKLAFEQVIDYYETVKSMSPIRILDTANDNGFGGTLNPAAPSVLDFTCDVESIIKIVIKSTTGLQKFIKTYIMGIDILNTKERNHIEQRIGQIFISRNIWPINKYFSVKRTKKQ